MRERLQAPGGWTESGNERAWGIRNVAREEGQDTEAVIIPTMITEKVVEFKCLNLRFAGMKYIFSSSYGVFPFFTLYFYFTPFLGKYCTFYFTTLIFTAITTSNLQIKIRHIIK